MPATRLARLGTETAFSVSKEAGDFAALGNTVYPFHLGDLNFATPQNIVDAAFKAIKDGKTGYCPNAGIPVLRELMANDINAARGTNYTANNVSIQPGGKPVIGKFLLGTMNPGDEVLYPNPGFPIYESLIEFHGGTAIPYGFVEGAENFELDLDRIEASITPKTCGLIFNNLHNPTGAESSHGELERLAALAVKYDLQVLADEAYFDVRYEGKTESITSFPDMGERTVILQTFSKKFAMTGWRVGAAIGPEKLIDAISVMNVNEESCTNHFIQYAAAEALQGDQQPAMDMLGVLKERRNRAVEILNSIPGVRTYSPEVTFYLFPNVTEAMANTGFDDYDEFRTAVLRATGVSFCTRSHFGTPLPGETERYIRLAYSGIDIDQIEEGLGKMKTFLESRMR
jgi:aspartate/methionine/tyrosine aminotransferase